MPNGISPNPLNPISQVYLDQVAKVKKAELEKDIERWTTKEEVVNEIIDPKGARRQDAAKPKKETPLTPEQKAKRDKANKQFDKDYYRPNPKEYPTMWKKRESTSEEKGFNFIRIL